MNNSKLGRKTEIDCCDWLSKQGWWCHRMVASEAGQPCDIVALKGDDCVLIDAKHCDDFYLRTSRIEPNQRSCFDYASRKFGIKCWFICQYEGALYRIKWEDVDLSKPTQRFELPPIHVPNGDKSL